MNEGRTVFAQLMDFHKRKFIVYAFHGCNLTQNLHLVKYYYTKNANLLILRLKCRSRRARLANDRRQGSNTHFSMHWHWNRHGRYAIPLLHDRMTA